MSQTSAVDPAPTAGEGGSQDEQARTLGVFAHPDDETLAGGAVLAMMAKRGPVTVVTGNRGERGEVIGAELTHLVDDPSALGRHRVGELAGAIDALGVSTQHFFDELPGLAGLRPAGYTDSGMQWPQGGTGVRAIPADDVAPDAFSLADTEVSARLLAGLVRRQRPHLVLTEEPDGGYGHPDHVQANRVTMRAVELAADADLEPLAQDDPTAGLQPWRVPVVAWVVRPASRVHAAMQWLDTEPDRPTVSAHSGGPHRVLEPGAGMPAIVRPDEQVDLDIDATAVLANLAGAMRAHATQIQGVQVDEKYLQRSGGHAAGWFALSNDLLQPVLSRATAMVAPGWGTAADLYAVVTGGAADRGGHGPAAAGVDDDGDETGTPRWYELTMVPFAFLIGLMIGAVGTAFHRWEAPFGLLMAYVAVLLGSVLARTFADSRGQVAYGAAVILIVFAMTYLTGRGDVIVTGQAVGTAWLVGAPIVSFLGALAPRRWFRG